MMIKMKMKPIQLAVALIVTGCTPAVFAGPTAPKDLNWLGNVSSAVLVATVETAEESNGALTLGLRVERGVHGTPEAGALVPVTWSGAPAGSAVTAAGVHGLWFLAGDAAAGWMLLPASDGDVDITRAAVPVPAGELPVQYAYDAGDPLLDKVVGELRAAFDSPDDALAGSAFAALATLSGPRVPVAARHAELYGTAHVEDCAAGQVPASLDSALVARAALRTAQGVPVPVELAANLCQVSDPTVAGGLAEVLSKKVSGPVARTCAAQALGNAHNSEALPHLRALLDSGEPDLEYAGLVGLALAANTVPPGRTPRAGPHAGGPASPATLAHFPSREVFEADPGPYLAFWRNWYPNVAPQVSVSGGGATCHPPAPWVACTLPAQATSNDANADAVSYQWNACSPALEGQTLCNVSALGANTLTVEASDGRGGTAEASLVLYGVNQEPVLSGMQWTPNRALALGEEATLQFAVADDDDDAYPWASCTVLSVYRNCRLIGWGCEADGGWVDVQVETTGGSRLCTVKIEWTDKWGARLVEELSAETL